MEHAVHSLKKDLRKVLKARLGNLPVTYRGKASHEIFVQVERMPAYESSSVIFCYLAMPQEVQTLNFIDRCLLEGKRIFVPKVTKNSNVMQISEVFSLADIENFPKSNWGIPEPPLLSDDTWKQVAYNAIDLVIVPGVGFDSSCQRIGHGKGYYDTFFAACEEFCLKNNKMRPTYLGVSFDEQLVEEVPTMEHDKRLDYVIAPSGVFSSPSNTEPVIDKADINEQCTSQCDSFVEVLSPCVENAMEVEVSEQKGHGMLTSTQVQSPGGSSEQSTTRSRSTGWSAAFLQATKVAGESDGCLADFMPEREAGTKPSEFGGFRQPDSLASFVSSTVSPALSSDTSICDSTVPLNKS